MKTIPERIATLDWTQISDNLHAKGYDIINSLVTPVECEDLKTGYDNVNLYRKTISMERYRFGFGEYKYFNYPLPLPIQQIRTNVYPHLARVANAWSKMLNMNVEFPPNHDAFLDQCHTNNQPKATPLILKYGKGGYNTLHQDLYGDVWFPLQAVLFLSDPVTDYTGGEFVMTQQTPRAQSKAIVLRPSQGDLLIFTTNFRPVKGTKGYYRSNMKHGVSELHGGERYTLGIIFHDAAS